MPMWSANTRWLIRIRFFLNTRRAVPTLQTTGSGKLIDVILKFTDWKRRTTCWKSAAASRLQDGQAGADTVTGMVGPPSVKQSGRDSLSSRQPARHRQPGC